MKKGLVGIVVFLAAFVFGTVWASLKRTDVDTAPSPGGPVNTVLMPVPEKPAVEEKDVSENNYGGWYALDKFTGMSEVTMISIYGSLAGDDEPYGGVFTTFENYGDQGVVGSAWIKVEGNHVRFGTEKINGVRYRFEGAFLSADWGHEGEKPLYGTLQKFVKGKKVAEVSGNFKYFEPHCLH